ncbi:tetratricopeptide repeat protein [Thermomonas sp.]|uniref:tetratricopeptide repeat protein n=1 Tax=Thermomonas sp. TaxID=1971895 RepID=UPI0035B3122C
MATTGGFIAELKRRNVIRMAGLYLVAAWLIVQVGATLLPVFDAPPWTMKALVLTLAVAFVPALAVAWIFELTPQGLKRDADVPPSESIAPKTARMLDRAIIVLLAIAVGYFAFDKFVLSPHREAVLVAETTRVASARVTAQRIDLGNSIAVLPLANASKDADQQFFADGLSDSLIATLSKFSGLKVIGRTSSFQFRDSQEDARTIGRKLGVEYLLSGSVQHAGESVRITVELVATREGTILWSHHYDRPYKDLFALQDDMATAIGGVLKARLLPGQKARNDRPPGGDLRAYLAFLQGNYYADIGREAEVRAAIVELGKATRIDPSYAMAWAELSRVWTSLAATALSGDEARDAYSEARRSGDRALALDPELAYAHIARGWLLENADLDWAGATREYKAAMRLAPELMQNRFSVGSMLALQGQLQDAVRLSREALATDPLAGNWWIWLAAYLSALGRLDEAEAAIRKAIQLKPDGSNAWTQLAIIELQRGDAKAALEAAKNEPEGVWREIALAMALQAGKDRAAADAALANLIADYGDVAAYQVAQVQALRNDADATFEWLERARANRDPGVGNTMIDPLVMRYKEDPRLAAFCETVGLPPPTESQTKGL